MVSLRKVGRQFATGVRAFDPITKGGKEARAEVRQVAKASSGAGKAALLVFGPPTAKTAVGAIAETALTVVPVGVARPAARLARGAVKAAVPVLKTVAKPAASLAPEATKALRGVKPAAQAGAKGVARAAKQTTAAVRSTGTKAAAATGSAIKGAVRGSARAGAAVGRSFIKAPVRTALGVGLGVGAAGVGINAATRGLRNLVPGGLPPASTIPGELRDQLGDLQQQVSDLSTRLGEGVGGAGGDLAGPDYKGGVLGNLTAGVGSAIDRVGDGISDVLESVGVAAGPGVGKALAVGAGLVVLGYGLTNVLPALAKTSSGFSGAKSGAPRVKAAGKAPRGSGGRFLKAVA